MNDPEALLHYLDVLLKENNFNFKKKFGQNFLQDTKIIDKIVSSEELGNKDLVIEIGPGQGALTKRLIKKTNVLAYEIDLDLKNTLNELMSNGNLSVIWGDFLERNIKEDLKDKKYNNLYIIANLPYYITTPIILKVIEEELNLNSMTVMVQKEVGDRFTTKPGNKEYGSITVFLNYYFEVKKLFDVSRNCFYPKPNVESCVLKLIPKKEKIKLKNEETFFKLIKDSFRFKRKTLKNNLLDYDLEKVESILKKYNLDLSIRAENLSLEIFLTSTPQ